MVNSQVSSYFTYRQHLTDNHSSSLKHFLSLGSGTLNPPDFLLHPWMLSMADSFSSSKILNIMLPQIIVFKTHLFSLSTTFQNDNLIQLHSFNTRYRLMIPIFAIPVWTAPHTSQLISPAAYVTFLLGYTLLFSNIKCPKTNIDIFPHLITTPHPTCFFTSEESNFILPAAQAKNLMAILDSFSLLAHNQSISKSCWLYL